MDHALIIVQWGYGGRYYAEILVKILLRVQKWSKDIKQQPILALQFIELDT